MPIHSIPLVSGEDVRNAITVADAIAAVEATFRGYGTDKAVVSVPPALFGPKVPGAAEFKVKGARVPGTDVMGLRIIADRYTEAGEESLAFCWVADTRNGDVMGVVEETALHRLRTAATGVVAARWLANPDPKVAVIVGTGRIADELPALLAEAFSLTEVRVTSRRRASSEAFVARHADVLAMTVAESVDAAVEGADIVIAITSATEPVLSAKHFHKGITVVGLGGGAEIAADALAAADRFVADDLSYAWMIGSIKGWIEEGLTRPEIEARLTADIGGVALGQTVRQGPEDSILAIVQGMAMCDVALAHAVLKGLPQA